MKNVKTIGCEEALKRLFQYLDRELGETSHDEVQNHISKCRTCYSRAEFEKKVKGRLEDIGKESVQSSLEERVRNILKKF